MWNSVPLNLGITKHCGATDRLMHTDGQIAEAVTSRDLYVRTERSNKKIDIRTNPVLERGIQTWRAERYRSLRWY